MFRVAGTNLEIIPVFPTLLHFAPQNAYLRLNLHRFDYESKKPTPKGGLKKLEFVALRNCR